MNFSSRDVILYVFIAVIFTLGLSFVFYEKTYSLSVANDFCKSAGYEGFRGIEYSISSNLSVRYLEGIACIDSEGVYHPVWRAASHE